MFGGVLNKKILSLAIPFVFANISVPLLGLVDTMMMGHLDEHYYIGAIALGSMIFNFVFWGFGFLKMGTTAFVAQSYGERNYKELMLVLYRGLLIAVFVGLIIILLQNSIWELAERLLMGSDEVLKYARQYFYIRIYTAPAVFFLYVFIGWFLGVQNALYVLYVMLVENISNIIFNLMFVYVFGMRSNGVALGTVCAQYLALIFALILFYNKYSQYVKRVAVSVILQKDAILKFLKANVDIMIRTLALMFVMAFFMNQSSGVNDIVLAANMILLQFVTLFSYFTDAFAHAGETLAGCFIGAKKIKAFKLLIYKLLAWGFVLSLIFTLLYGLGFNYILKIMTSQQKVINAAYEFRYWLIAMPLLSFIAYIWDGIFIGITKTKQLRNTMLIAAIMVFLPSFYIFKPYVNNHSLWLALSLFMLTRGLVLSVFAKKIVKQM